MTASRTSWDESPLVPTANDLLGLLWLGRSPPSSIGDTCETAIRLNLALLSVTKMRKNRASTRSFSGPKTGLKNAIEACLGIRRAPLGARVRRRINSSSLVTRA